MLVQLSSSSFQGVPFLAGKLHAPIIREAQAKLGQHHCYSSAHVMPPVFGSASRWMSYSTLQLELRVWSIKVGESPSGDLHAARQVGCYSTPFAAATEEREREKIIPNRRAIL